MDHLDVRKALQIPFPRTKRPHRKSRLGCGPCKLRRVKCDEVKPVCNACHRKGLDCRYDDRSARTSKVGYPVVTPGGIDSVNTAPSPPSDSPGSEKLSDDSMVEEVELTRTYLEHVSSTFSESCTRQEQTWIWQVMVPSQAYRCGTVLSGMMAAAALYLHFQAEADEAQAERYLQSATLHGNAFVKQSRDQLHALEFINTEADLCSARLLCILAFGFFRQRRKAGTDQESKWTWVLMLRGVQTVHQSLMGKGRKIHPVFLHDMIMDDTKSQGSAPPAQFLPSPDSHSPENELSGVLAYLDNTRQERFTTLRLGIHQGWFAVVENTSSLIQNAIESLSDVTAWICTNKCHSRFRVIFSWISNLPNPLAQMLIEEHPGMLALYTHWLMLVMLLEHQWWVGDMGRAGILHALQLLGDTKHGLAPVLAWAEEILQHF